jgi:cyclohexyl-isocyanide hydratase
MNPDESKTPNALKHHLTIGCLIFQDQDQIDFTGPFEVLSRIPDVSIHIIGKTLDPVRDIKGLILTPDMMIKDAPQLDLLHVSGGIGQQALMDDKEIGDLIRDQFYSGRYVFSVCTGALLCGASGILKDMKATTHWAAWELLPYYGAIPVKQRVVVDRNLITAAGVTAGIDGALQVAMLLRGREVAEAIQLEIEYAPEPCFNSGSPETASEDAIQRFFTSYGKNKDSRKEEALRFAQKFGYKISGID